MDELWAALDGAVRPLLLQICAPLDQLVETLGVGAVDPADPLANLRLAVVLVLLVSGTVLAAKEGTRLAAKAAAPVYFRRTSGSEIGKVERLDEYDGNTREPVYLAVKGRVFDVSRGAEFYGPDGGSYNALAGQDASRALGIMSLQGRDKWVEDCCIRRIDDLGHKQYKVMREWEAKYVEKYPIVGVLLGQGTVGGVDFVPAEGGPIEQLIRADQFHWAAGPKGAAEAASRALDEAAKEHDIMWPMSTDEQEGAATSVHTAVKSTGTTTVETSMAKRRQGSQEQ